MKKIRYYALVVIFSFASFVASASNVESTEPADHTDGRVEQIESRVHEIWKMDFSKMEKIEKLAIKEELKAIKKEIKSTEGLDNKVSISVGAIIIILLIIIIIA